MQHTNKNGRLMSFCGPNGAQSRAVGHLCYFKPMRSCIARKEQPARRKTWTTVSIAYKVVLLTITSYQCLTTSFIMKAALPDTTFLAVTQQGAAFAVTLVAEGLFTRSQLPESSPGRPSLLPVVASTLGLVAALGLMRLGDQGQQLGLIVGGTTSAIMLAISVKRSIDTKGDERDWPGPKAWPIFISTGAFFAMLAFFQALQYL